MVKNVLHVNLKLTLFGVMVNLTTILVNLTSLYIVELTRLY
jgi:hypothetical protein